MGETLGLHGDQFARLIAGSHRVRWRLLAWVGALAVLGALNAWVHADSVTTRNHLLTVASKSREHASDSQLLTTRCLALSQGIARTQEEERELQIELCQAMKKWDRSHTELSHASYIAGVSLDDGYAVSHARLHTVVTAFVNQVMAAPSSREAEIAARNLLTQSDEHTIENEKFNTRVVKALSRTDPNSKIIRGASILVALLIVYQIAAESVRQAIRKDVALRELEDRTSRQQRLLATMSHELRTPLASIMGNAELLKSDTSEEPDGERFLSTITKNCNHLLGLIDGFLGESRAQAPTTATSLSCVRIADVVEESAEICRNHAESKGIQLFVSIDQHAPEWIITDALRLRQILLNLLGNAIRHTKHGYVRIAFEGGSGSPDEPVLVRVADTGCGIAPDELESIFQPSYQSAKAEAVGSAGLGLAICRELATSLGGNITVKSSLGVGSEFIVSIPRHLSFVVDNSARRESVIVADYHPLKGRTIVLAEDSPDIQHIIGTHLRRAGATVIVIGSGQTLVDHFGDNANRPDLVLVDIHLDDLSGIHATRLIRSRGVHIPILALSASDTADDRAACRAAGCDAYLTKPIDAQTLVRICTTWATATAPQAA